MAEELLGINEAAALLGVHRTQIDRWIRSGKLEAVTLPPAYRRAGKWRYVKRAAVERLKAERGERPRRQSPGGDRE